MIDKLITWKKKPAEHFTENKMRPIDRCGCIRLFNYQGFALIKQEKEEPKTRPSIKKNQ
jgi:hypothetical protein